MYKRILVPVDGSATSNLALGAALRLAQAFNSQLRLIHVLDVSAYLAGYDPYAGSAGDLPRAMREAGEKILQDGMAVARAAGVEVDNMLFDTLGRLGETVANAAKLWNADLLVVGTHGRRGLSRLLLGSGAEQIIRLSPVHALVVRGDEDEVGSTGS